MPSKSENFGYSVLEAMLNGIPVTTNTTAWTMLEEKNVGWIIDGNLKNLETVLEKVFEFIANRNLKTNQLTLLILVKNFIGII